MIKLWLDEFTHAINIGFLEYKKSVMRGNDVSVIFFRNDTGVYLTQHLCIQNILQKKVKDIPPILFLDALKTMFKLQMVDCMTEENKEKYFEKGVQYNTASERKMIAKCTGDKFLNDTVNVKKIPYIKITRYHKSNDIIKFLEKETKI